MTADTGIVIEQAMKFLSGKLKYPGIWYSCVLTHDNEPSEHKTYPKILLSP